MPQPGREPSPLRRAAAAAALAALVAALLYLAISAVFHWYILLASVISLGVVVVAAWFILSRHQLRCARAVRGILTEMLRFGPPCVPRHPAPPRRDLARRRDHRGRRPQLAPC